MPDSHCRRSRSRSSGGDDGGIFRCSGHAPIRWFQATVSGGQLLRVCTHLGTSERRFRLSNHLLAPMMAPVWGRGRQCGFLQLRR